MKKKFSFQTKGYEALELSTQILIAEALRRKVKVEVLDSASQFIRLSKNGRIEYVESATKTSKDSYISSVMLGNKVVTKMVLEEAGIRTPHGRSYDSYQSALKDNAFFAKSKIVVKPKTTNYGIGITMLEADHTLSDFKKALEHAFEYDRSVIVEEFISGIECRFLVIHGQAVAVLHRIPAHVVGDGLHTIRQLVESKNKSPLRGEGHTTPLEKIKITDVEKAVLAEQKFMEQSVPPKGMEVFLRKNSNISTGGDSIDYTDLVHESYKKIAVLAARAVNVSICGVDVMLRNYKEPAQGKGSSPNYAIIELNYNPVLYFHDFPAQGKNRHVERHVLDLLGF